MADPQPQLTNPKGQHLATDTTLVAPKQEFPESAPGNEKSPLLPAEIIFSICRYFTALVELHNPAKSFDVSSNTRDNTRTLRQLSITCRSIHHEVTPALYTCIYFTGPTVDPDLPVSTDSQHTGAESLVYFLRTMVENVGLRRHVKDVACLIHLRDRCLFKEQMNTQNKDYGLLSAIQNCKDIRTTRLIEWARLWIAPFSDHRGNFENAFGTSSRRPIISISHQVFTLIACLLPNVTSVTLKTTGRNPLYPGQASSYDMMQHHMQPLQNLTVLHVQCEPETTGVGDPRESINISHIMPLLRNASNLQRVQCYGSDSTWVGCPESVTSFECWGPVLKMPVAFSPQHLQVVVVHFHSAMSKVEFNLGNCCRVLSLFAPQLKQLKVLCSPGTSTRRHRSRGFLGLTSFTALEHFCFDSRFFPDTAWDEPIQGFLRDEWVLDLSQVGKLSILDSKPRRNLDNILNWLQDIMRDVLKPQNDARLKTIEYLHMPSLADMNHDSSSYSPSTVADELRQELALNGVQFQLSFVKDTNGEFSEAEVLKQNHIPRQANGHDIDN
ncbi:hypothetical protein DHEL01_v211912 [Diaporthe helianthi]|uniref:Uncharacterized protein n=1 Tax=Diaporthe helianthi TaxID=158607 RepID=A0A2P5HHH3_DIAHE|nr:hypothetical protein DHEL01_v211912 [Diaporthe helianthi]